MDFDNAKRQARRDYESARDEAGRAVEERQAKALANVLEKLRELNRALERLGAEAHADVTLSVANPEDVVYFFADPPEDLFGKVGLCIDSAYASFDSRISGRPLVLIELEDEYGDIYVIANPVFEVGFAFGKFVPNPPNPSGHAAYIEKFWSPDEHLEAGPVRYRLDDVGADRFLEEVSATLASVLGAYEADNGANTDRESAQQLQARSHKNAQERSGADLFWLGIGAFAGILSLARYLGWF